ncbi:MAG: hypothetical protein FWH55_09195, partial [Oscillospiraceae bacterium]|nr:hypothetical protein [Oscillospiraceae bacterium]
MKRASRSTVKKRLVSMAIALSLILSMGTGFSFAAPAAPGGSNTLSPFGQYLESKYIDPDRVYSSDVRWWLGEAAYTDETLMEEVQALYDAGFRGVELCMQSDTSANDQLYAYGSEMWSHKWRLMMNKLLDLGMGVYLTSGTHWATSNVPGLDPDSQQTSQVIAMGSQKVNAGQTITALPKPGTTRASNAGKFISAYAYKLVSETPKTIISQSTQNFTYTEVDYDSMIDLSQKTTFTEGATIYDQAINWTAPDDGVYVVYAFWTHGNYVTASPAAQTCYATNYFDVRGVEALRTFWEANYLNDPELNKKILAGDVQLFMDSLEINPTGGITWWSEDIRQVFIDRKGYDILPYLFLVQNLPQVQAVYNPYFPPAQGYNGLASNDNLREKIVNDWVDIITQMYCENMLVPLKDWLNSVGIETRAQISYGRSFEITEPSMYVDYPDAENYNQYNNIDIMRLHTAGSKLQNKVTASETGAELAHSTTIQTILNDGYSMYAAGVQRQIWHVWSSGYGYYNDTGSGTSTPASNYAWPGYSPTDRLRFGTRTPTIRDFDEFNAHLGRIQQLLQTGKSRTDIGFIHNNWNQGLRYGGSGHSNLGGGRVAEKINGMNYMLAHQGVYYRSTELQDNGYTYDYFSPKFLYNDNVSFNEITKTIEPAGYKALVLYQDWLDVKGAERILEWAKKGLPVAIMDGAAVRTTFNDGNDAKLAQIITELKTLPNVKSAAIYTDDSDFNYFLPLADGYEDGLYKALQELGVRPYAEFIEPNHQLLTQSRTDSSGNLYLYAFNYCPNDYHQYSYIESVQTEDHGTNIKTEIKMDGMFIPYNIDAWSGKVTELGNYRYENGQTVFAIDLDYNNVALFAFEAVRDERLHIVETNAEAAYALPGSLVIRATVSGAYNTVLSNGASYQNSFSVPAPYDITNWELSVESWTANPVAGDLWRFETIGSLHTANRKTSTVKTPINVKLDKLTTWNNIPGVGREHSGLGHYFATFNWAADKADGAYLDFGATISDTMKVWINGQKVGGDACANPTKVRRSVGVAIDGVIPEGKILYTGGVSWTRPIIDIGEYLVDGVNEIEIEYSSAHLNAMLASGAVSQQTNRSGWWGHHVQYLDNGPHQAVLVPYVEQVLQVFADIRSDEAAVGIGAPASYTVSLNNATGAGVVTLSFTADSR